MCVACGAQRERFHYVHAASSGHPRDDQHILLECLAVCDISDLISELNLRIQFLIPLVSWLVLCGLRVRPVLAGTLLRLNIDLPQYNAMSRLSVIDVWTIPGKSASMAGDLM